ncbi:MAG: hypothetical protein WBD40_21770 [Tepidisphaeraceae bacterium]
MRQSVRRWGAAAVGLSFPLACQVSGIRAGTVAPPAVEPMAVVSESDHTVNDAIGEPAPLPLRPMDGWVSPAIEANSIGINSVPVRTPEELIAVGGATHHPVIPLPGAAWTGMAGLMALGGVKALRNVRRLLA